MKKIKFLYQILPFLCAFLCLGACDNSIKDITKVEEKLELSVSSRDIVLDLDNPREFVLTFDWTEPRNTSDENLVFYTTKLDVVGNNFGTSTAIINAEEEGVFKRSFTSEQLYSWMTERWNVPLTKPLQIEFRIVVHWEGGPTFEAPEVRTETVTIAALKEEVAIPDMIALSGSAVNNKIIEMEKTLENENIYAALLNLDVGELTIPIVSSGDMKYLNAKDDDGLLKDGITEDVVLQEKRGFWTIETAGEYRVVLNLEDSKVTIYSPNNQLQPAVVTWVKNSDPVEEVQTTVEDLYLFGGGTGWGWWKGNCSVSLADPQILIYHGDALTSGDGVKFVVYGESDYRNVAYAFTNPLTPENERQNMSLAMDKLGELHGGFDGETRNSYYKLPSGANFIVLDLRNKTIIARKK